ncbi:MAG: Flp/Fap pilin component [Firmicutes bacterium]|nr:Flp/Fap pilin component [Bacillota bacterium]
MLKMYWEALKSRCLNEKGQGMVEYGLILALVAIFAMGAFTGVGTAIINKLGEVVTALG